MSNTPLSQEQLEKLFKALLNGATVAQAAGVSKDTLEGLYALAHGLYTSANYHDAQIVFQALSLYDATDYRFWMGLGACRQAQEQYEAAIDAYQMAAVASSLKNPDPIIYASKCLVKLGRKEDAIAGLKTAIKIGGESDPSHEAALKKAAALLKLLEGAEK